MSARRFTLLFALPFALALGGACIDGDFSLGGAPVAPKNAIGLACSSADECASGACVDGVCCRSGCEANETCGAPGKVGTCSLRELGAVCTSGDQCPTGHCVDGVCCDSACTDRCTSCRNEGQAGRCAPALDNTDLRGECGTCSACFGGLCAPAEPGTDPNGACAPTERCGASQRCGKLRGGECTIDEACATGQCVAGICQAAAFEQLPAGTLGGDAQHREVLSLTGDRDGSVAALVVQLAFVDNVVTEHQLVLATRRAGQGWTVTPLLEEESFARIPGAVASLGRWLYVASHKPGANGGSNPSCGTAGEVPCGLFGQLVLPNGQLGGYEEIDADARSVLWVQLHSLDDGGLLAVWAEKGQSSGPANNDTISLRHRDPTTLEWSPRVVLADAASVGLLDAREPLVVPAFAVSDRTATLIHSYTRMIGSTRYPEVHARTIELGAASEPFGVKIRPVLPISLPVLEDGALPCSPFGALRSALEPESAGTSVTSAFLCVRERDEEQLVARYRPHLPVDRRWELEPIERSQTSRVAVPLGRVGDATLFAEVPDGRRELQLTWRDGEGWQHRTPFALTGQRLIADVMALPGEPGAPRLMVTVRPATVVGAWETWFADFGR